MKPELLLRDLSNAQPVMPSDRSFLSIFRTFKFPISNTRLGYCLSICAAYVNHTRTLVKHRRVVFGIKTVSEYIAEEEVFKNKYHLTIGPSY